MNFPTYARIRSIILFIVGVGGVIYELVVTGTDRPALLVLLGMFAGLPLVFNVDKLIQHTSLTSEPEPIRVVKKKDLDEGDS